MSMSGRHLPKHVAESSKEICRYCRRTPALWEVVGSEKICAHCGTRVYDSSMRTPAVAGRKVAAR
ncbi:MAG: hypothetical protein JNJ61_31045 [Anaerolineae bacterium]|nr:hypothetical protein [Anaerolineae bacterium]